MSSFIRYVTYLLVILLCLFLLQKNGVNVKDGIGKGSDRIRSFIYNVKEDIDSGKTNATTSTSTDTLIKGISTSTIKGYTGTGSKNINKIDTGMSVAGVLKYTNIERVKNGLKPLALNTKLSNSAIAKVDDMFTFQYFEHTSPEGKTAADLVRSQGYNFQSVGENLALGDFGNDKNLVDAWMNSPLHRKNILNPRFTEIGLGVAKGMYNGETQWLAVQHFGRPVPVCPEVSEMLKGNVDAEKNSLELEEAALKKMADEIEADPNQNKSKEFLDAYNARVATYNARLGTLRDMIKEYNTKVDVYNACLTS
ncbi:MAG: CAP domain-containing protein [Patescibacteria group bacterium]